MPVPETNAIQAGLLEQTPLVPLVPEPPKLPEFRIEFPETASTECVVGLPAEARHLQLGDRLMLFPKSPYDVVTKNGQVEESEAQYSLGTCEARTRKDISLLEKVRYTPDTVTFIGKPHSEMSKGQMVLVPLPNPGETVVLEPGLRADGKRLHAPVTILNNQGNLMIQHADGSKEVLPLEFGIVTHEQQLSQKRYIYPPERKGEIASTKLVFTKDIVHAGVKRVVVDGIDAFLVEAVEDIQVGLDPRSIDRVHDSYRKLANTEAVFPKAAMISEVHPGHPYRNEDAAVRLLDGTNIVCDGMGGYEGGYANSRLARFVVTESLGISQKVRSPQEVQQAFSRAIWDTHTVLKQYLHDDGDTTIVLSRVVLDPKTRKKVLVWANVGDSAVMVVRGSDVIHVSQDDNALESLSHGKHLNQWIQLKPKHLHLLNYLRESGFPVRQSSDGTYVFFREQQVRLIQDILDSFSGFGQFTKDSLIGYLRSVINQTSGVKYDIENPTEDIHSGIFELLDGDVVMTGSDGPWDPVNQAGIVLAVANGNKDPLKIAKNICAAADGVNAEKDEYSQRAKKDDKSLIVEVV